MSETDAQIGCEPGRMIQITQKPIAVHAISVGPNGHTEAIRVAAQRYGVFYTGTVINHSERSGWPWSKWQIVKQEARLTARHADRQALDDFLHEIDAKVCP